MRLIFKKKVININLNKFKNNKEIPLMESPYVWGNIYFDEKFIPITQDVIPGIYDYYLISNYGKIYQKYTGKFLTYSIYQNKNGNQYYSVGLITTGGLISVRVHRLVLACFYPELGPINQDNDVNHKNGITNDNYISYNDYNRGNREWLSHSDNMKHAYRTGLAKSGENHFNATISNETAIEIIKLLSLNKYTSKEICNIIGNSVNINVIDSIRKKESWKFLSKEYDFYQRPSKLFTEEQIHQLCIYFKNNKKPEDITVNDFCRMALLYNNLSIEDRYVDTVRKIYNRKYYTKISSQYIF